MIISLKAALGVVGLAAATTAAAQVTLYSRENLHGRQFSTDRTVSDMDRAGFNDRASSAAVNGGDWQICEEAHFRGRCVVLQPGEYRSLADVGLQNISSVRPADQSYGNNERRDDRAYVAQDSDRRQHGFEYQRRGDEQLYEASVSSVHAVVGPPQQRCWVERNEMHGDANVPGAIAGAVIGGILGHQIGGGRGRDVATASGQSPALRSAQTSAGPTTVGTCNTARMQRNTTIRNIGTSCTHSTVSSTVCRWRRLQARRLR